MNAKVGLCIVSISFSSSPKHVEAHLRICNLKTVEGRKDCGAYVLAHEK